MTHLEELQICHIVDKYWAGERDNVVGDITPAKLTDMLTWGVENGYIAIPVPDAAPERYKDTAPAQERYDEKTSNRLDALENKIKELFMFYNEHEKRLTLLDGIRGR